MIYAPLKWPSTQAQCLQVLFFFCSYSTKGDRDLFLMCFLPYIFMLHSIATGYLVHSQTY